MTALTVTEQLPVTEQLRKYVYCIIRCAEEPSFDGVSAIDDPAGPVHTVSHQGLAVVASDAAARDYEATRAHLLAHGRVLERVMQEFTLLPVRFGTVTPVNGVPASAQIRKLLAGRFYEFDRLLSEMDGTVELGIKALWRDLARVFEDIATQDTNIRRLREWLGTAPAKSTPSDLVRVGEMVRDALHRKRLAQANELLAPLRRIARRVVENDPLSDRMIANAAFLVDEGRQGEFDRTVRQLDAELEQTVLLKYVGPVPPYNFVNITVNWQEVSP